MKASFLSVGILCVSSVAALAQTQVSSLPTPNEIFKEVSPAVVLIEVEDGAGSGFIVSTDGKIVTNFHVIEHTRRATVRLTNGDAYDSVEVVDVDKRKDIAVLKIKAVDLPTVHLGESKTLETGTPVFSISNPLGDKDLKNTFSSGIVSGVRESDGYHLVQITAAISPGSSGSPVLDGHGNVIGIAKGNVPGGQQLNFCIPIDYVKGLLRTTGTQPLSVTYTPPPPPTETSTTPPPGPGPNPEPKSSVNPPPTSTAKAESKSVALYVKCIGGTAGAVSQFGTGTSPANFVPYLNSLPASCPTLEVPIGTITDATQTIPFGIHTVWGRTDYWAFSTGTDQASKVAFTDVNNSLGLGGDIVQKTGTNTMVMHLNDAAHYLVGSDEANNILIQVRLVVDESQPTISQTSDAKAGTIDGSWSATVADAKASGNLNFNLIQNSDGQVVGTYTSSLGGGGSIKGQLTGIDFRFELTQTIAGCPGIYKGDGTRIGDNIAGSYTGNDCLGDRGTGKFTMTRGTGTQPTSHATSSVSPVPDEMRKSVGDFLATRILVWSEQDARTVMGEPLSHRYRLRPGTERYRRYLHLPRSHSEHRSHRIGIRFQDEPTDECVPVSGSIDDMGRLQETVGQGRHRCDKEPGWEQDLHLQESPPECAP